MKSCYKVVNKHEKLAHLSDKEVVDLMKDYYETKLSVKELLEKYKINEKPRNFVSVLPPEELDDLCPICQSKLYIKRRSRQDRSRPKVPFCLNCGHMLDKCCTCDACLAERNARYRRYEENRWVDVRTRKAVYIDDNGRKYLEKGRRQDDKSLGKYNVEVVNAEGIAGPQDKNIVEINGKRLKVDGDISMNLDEEDAYIFDDYSKVKRENPLKTLLLKYYRNNDIEKQKTENLSFQNRIYLGALLRHTTTPEDRTRLKSLFSISRETGKHLASFEMEKRLLIALYLLDYLVVDEDCRLDYYDDRDRFTVGFLGRITEYTLNLGKDVLVEKSGVEGQADSSEVSGAEGQADSSEVSGADSGVDKQKLDQADEGNKDSSGADEDEQLVLVFNPERDTKKRGKGFYTVDELMYPKGTLIYDGYDLRDAYSLWCATVLYDAIDYVSSYIRTLEVEYMPKISDMKLYKGIFGHYTAAQFWWMVDEAWERTDKKYQANNQRRRKLIERKFVSNIRAVYGEIRKGQLEVGEKDLKTCDRHYSYNEFLFNEVLHIGDRWFYEQASVLPIIENMPKHKYIDENGEDMNLYDYWLFELWKMERDSLFYGMDIK